VAQANVGETWRRGRVERVGKPGEGVAVAVLAKTCRMFTLIVRVAQSLADFFHLGSNPSARRLIFLDRQGCCWLRFWVYKGAAKIDRGPAPTPRHGSADLGEAAPT